MWFNSFIFTVLTDHLRLLLPLPLPLSLTHYKNKTIESVVAYFYFHCGQPFHLIMINHWTNANNVPFALILLHFRSSVHQAYYATTTKFNEYNMQHLKNEMTQKNKPAYMHLSMCLMYSVTQPLKTNCIIQQLMCYALYTCQTGKWCERCIFGTFTRR